MNLEDMKDAERTLQSLMKVPFDAATRKGLIKADVIVHHIADFRRRAPTLKSMNAALLHEFLGVLFEH